MVLGSCRQSKLTKDTWVLLMPSTLCHTSLLFPPPLCVGGQEANVGVTLLSIFFFSPFPFKVGILGMELWLDLGGFLVTNTASGATSPACTLLSWLYLWLGVEWWNCYLFSKSRLFFSWIFRAPFVIAEVWRGGLQCLGATEKSLFLRRGLGMEVPKRSLVEF